VSRLTGDVVKSPAPLRITGIEEWASTFSTSKTLHLLVDFPGLENTRASWPRAFPSHFSTEMRFHCTYRTTGKTGTSDGRPTVLIEGTNGPFRVAYWVAFTPQPQWPDSKPWMSVFIDGVKRNVWLSTWEGDAPRTYISLTYRAPGHGNLWHCGVEVKALRRAISHFMPTWTLHEVFGRPTLVQLNRKPSEDYREVYPSAHRDGTWGARVRWYRDTDVCRSEDFLGMFATEAAANAGCDAFCRKNGFEPKPPKRRAS
jgi:hypothetical protein